MVEGWFDRRRTDRRQRLRSYGERKWGVQFEEPDIDDQSLRLWMTIQGDDLMAVTMSDTQQVVITISAVDAKGNPATISGIPTWSVDDVTIAVVVPAADGMSALVKAAVHTGTATVTATATSGGTTLTGQVLVTVVGGAPISLVMSPGTPTTMP